MSGLAGKSVGELLSLYRDGAVRPAEVVGDCLDAIDSRDRVAGAFLEVFRDAAIARAEELGKEDPGGLPLYGIPVAVKDNICVRGLPTTCGSKILGGYCPPYDATAVERLMAAGAIIIGKTNMDEFAMGSSNEYSAFGRVRNPWNEECAPGGSSGGSAAAVAAGMVPAALGSDTGGSIRQPASFCGVTGLKGTYGRISRYGLVAFASSFDQIGPIANDAEGCALLMQALAGHDGKDSTAIEEDCPDLLSGLDAGLAGLSFGIPEELGGWDLDPAVASALDESSRAVTESGAALETVPLPGMETSIACYYVIANAEASSNLARFDGVRYGMREDAGSIGSLYISTRTAGFGEEVKRRILLGTYVLSAGYYDAYYGKALSVREIIRKAYDDVFSRIDLLMLPATPGPAFRLGEKIDDPVAMYLSDIFTTPANLAGLPAISIPAGLSADGLPVGVQLVASAGREDVLLRGARGLEKLFRFRERFVSGGCDS
jgi:aspartyl-tRNA(Asn)/glutamyl-tRNA(Gln) amidotransferase subunit A